ncbi:DUF305 domain-containing protein [Nonomuraea sp. K274]|uniref:DUF305 domain-containing protein n=1 Tax=Nonomuraea cypriaca TaxID=1187855 RepID=A0A931AHM5_9ACTN|nr:DUF305 domain-containing protein [Nonomuraea cypriaca]MBF8192851.1 DUF305 domain-containing protein [Nonomuraea cypriaca]
MLRGFSCLLLFAVLLGCSAPGEPPAPRSTDVRFTTTDVAWLQLADALHTRALPVLELAEDRAADRPLAGLAARLGDRHERERARLRDLLAQARVTGENPHAAHDMPGMPTSDDLRTLTGSDGDAFDRRFAGLLRAYLDQSVLMAKGEQSAGGDREVRELAAVMEREHAADLADLERIAPT